VSYQEKGKYARQTVANRQAEQEFIARGLKARDQAKQTEHYIEASAVVERLQGCYGRDAAR